MSENIENNMNKRILIQICSIGFPSLTWIDFSDNCIESIEPLWSMELRRLQF